MSLELLCTSTTTLPRKQDPNLGNFSSRARPSGRNWHGKWLMTQKQRCVCPVLCPPLPPLFTTTGGLQALNILCSSSPSRIESNARRLVAGPGVIAAHGLLALLCCLPLRNACWWQKSTVRFVAPKYLDFSCFLGGSQYFPTSRGSGRMDSQLRASYGSTPGRTPSRRSSSSSRKPNSVSRSTPSRLESPLFACATPR